MQLKERGIVLSKTKYGEADLILKVITSLGEVYSVIAKSALRSKKRFGGGVLEPMHFVAMSLTKKESEDFERLAILNEAHIINDFSELKKDYDRISLALHFIRTVSTVAREGDLHSDLFNLLGHALKECEVSEHLSVLKLQFDLKVLHSQGVLPHLEIYLPYIRKSIREGADLVNKSSELHHLIQDVDGLLVNYLT